MKKLALCAALLVLLSACMDTRKTTPKTLLIGMDGVQLAHYEQLGPKSNLRRLHFTKAYAGGITGRATQQSTISGPGWTTLLTGVWANKHGVISNDTNLRANPEFPGLFRRIRAAQPDAFISSIINWSPINTAFLVEDVKSNNVTESGLTDEQVTLRTLDVLENQPADFTFIQLDEPDTVGHESGFGEQYTNALRAADERLGRLLDKVEERARLNPDEDWLILLSTDHGRDATGHGHQGQSEQEKTIFIASNKHLNAEFTRPSIPEDNPGPNDLYGFAAQTSIAPTVLRHMGVALNASSRLDGTPLLGETGVRKARANQPNTQLLWNSQDNGLVVIEKNGRPVAEVAANIQHWKDPDGMAGVNDYLLLLNETPAAVRTGVQTSVKNPQAAPAY